MNNEKVKYGQYYTNFNCFKLEIFKEWFDIIPDNKKQTILEPFAGSNNIVKLINDIGIKSKWKCYDILPSRINQYPKYEIKEQDTLKNFPSGYFTVITNPPYLGKSSAKRRGINFPDTIYDDLYKYSLAKMLDNCEYIAAIIPESFITQGLFHDRLYAVASLTYKMFNDTECPVCLALFVPKYLKKQEDFKIYENDKFIGSYQELKAKSINSTYKVDCWKSNNKGSIGVICIDNTKEDSIKFIKGEELDNEIKNSRAFLRLEGLPKDINRDEFLKYCNNELGKYRKDTNDVLLTAFKGLRTDNKYRRRLDFKTAKQMLSYVLEKYERDILNKAA